MNVGVSMNSVRHTDAISLLKSFDDGSVPLIVADPPYGIAYHSNHYKDKNPHSPMANDWNFQAHRFFQAASIVLSDGGAAYVFSRWDVYPLWVACLTPPLKLKNIIIWKKDNWSAGDLNGDFGNQYEVIMFITKGRHLRRGHRWSNVWEFARVPSKRLRHPAEKPVEMIKRIVESSSDIDGLVVDPFCGSGTTGEAAAACGRKFILGDVDPMMVRKSCERLGLPIPISSEDDSDKNECECPIFRVVPPDPSLWGIHPEDIKRWIEKLQCEPG
jgi:site-specific DNA-methyltransferase (adenine-specific)